MKPIIGIVSRIKKDEDSTIIYSNDKVFRSIISCGGIPIQILPPQDIDYESDIPKNITRLNDSDKENLNEVLKLVDGVILPGGDKWYEFDEYICRYVVDNNIPVLGICAGMQLLSKVLNNDKELDPTIKIESYINHKQNLDYVHEVKIKNDSLLYSILKKDSISVNSRHYYKVPDELGFMATAYSPDGVIEAVEYPKNKFTLGVQWHPESMMYYDIDAKKIIEAFIDSCKK